MFDVFYWGPKPGLFAFEQPADSLEHAATLSRTKHYWYIYGGNDYTGFDFDQQPVPWQSDFVHVWPSQWQRDGGVYLANCRTADQPQWHWRTDQQVRRLPSTANWSVPGNITGVDFSWHPDPHEPAYIYHFPDQWQSASGVTYTVSGATNIKLCDQQVVQSLPSTNHWTVPEEINSTAVDFSWHPNALDPPYIYHFGTDYQQSVGLTYTVPGATDIKFAGPVPGTENPLEVLDIFYIDRGNATAQTRWERLHAQYPQAQKVRYANSIMDTIQRCVRRATTNKFWVISSEYDYTDFDFAWHPAPWQSYMTHVFPSQWQKWSDTFLINRWEFERHSEWATGLEQFPNLNFVTDQQVVKPDATCNIYYVDHGNAVSRHQYEYLRLKHPDMVITRFVDNYLDTFKRIMSTAETEYVWIINSVCDYSQFDFSWQPEPWQQEMIHVFPSGMQERGDTFYIHVESFKRQMIELELLDWFNVINYCSDQTAPRFDMPVHVYESDDLVEEIKRYTFAEPYAMFTNQPDLRFAAVPCLWTEKDRVVERCSASGATCIVPRDIKRYLRTQIYDYPHLETSVYQVSEYYRNKKHPGLDIVYISNGEPDEQRWYDHLSYTTGIANIEWVRGVNGRVAAYQEAARRSTTPWFFAVFAKLEIVDSFPCADWRPDYYQEPKHYIFNARNPVNGLEYGHMGVIAYNKNLVLANNNPGIDFTLSQPHESVPVLSAVAHFNQDAWTTWRTAFREVLKLKHFMATSPTLETEHRLHVWCTQAQGNHSDYCLKGAQDAVNYYNEVGGDYDKLKLSFEWVWLKQRFNAGS